MGALVGGEDGVFALRAGDGGVPREGLILQNHAVRRGRAEVVAALVAARAALMVELPFVREPDGVVGGDGLAEDVFHRRADLAGEVQLGVHGTDGVVAAAEFFRDGAKVNHARERDDEAVLPRAEDDLGELAELLRRRARVAVVLDAVVGGDEDDDGREVARPSALGEEAGDLELRLARLEALAGLVHGRFRCLAERAVAFHLGLTERVVQRSEEVGARGGAPIAAVGECPLRVSDGLERLERAVGVVPLAEQGLRAEALHDLVLQAAHLDAIGEEVEALRSDDELAEAEVAVERDVGLAAAGEPREVRLQAEQRGVGFVFPQERADLGEFEFEFGVHGKGIATGFRLPIKSAHPKRRCAQLNFFR